MRSEHPSVPAASPRCLRLTTDRPGEAVELVRVPFLSGASFWRVEHSDRLWSMLHDTFAASVLRGPSGISARWSSRGVERSASVRSVQLMEPGDLQKTTALSQPASFFVVWWEREALAEAASELGLSGPVRFACAQSECSALATALDALDVELAADSGRLAIETRFSRATETVLRIASRGEGAPSAAARRHPRVRRAVDYLHDHFHRDVSLEALAREANLSKFHLARSFRAVVGIPPHRYLVMLRLQAARRHLERGTPVEEAAELTGFADAPHLTRTFRRWLGVPPGSWARAAKTLGMQPSASAPPPSP